MPDDAPWEAAAPPPEHPASDASRRYQRAQRLTQFARELATWERLGQLDAPHRRAQVAYRRACLARWEAYLDGWQPAERPQGGRRPRR